MASTQRVALTCTLVYTNSEVITPIANQLVSITNQSGGGSPSVWNALTGGTTVSSVTTDSTGNLNGSVNSYFIAEGSYIIGVPSSTHYSAFNVYFEAVHGAGIGNLSSTLLNGSIGLNSNGALAINDGSNWQTGDIIWSAATTRLGALPANGASIAIGIYLALDATMLASGYPWGCADSGHYYLPNLNGRTAIGASSTYALGSTGGESTIALNLAQIPSHTHTAGYSSTGITVNATTTVESNTWGPSGGYIYPTLTPGSTGWQQGPATASGSPEQSAYFTTSTLNQVTDNGHDHGTSTITNVVDPEHYHTISSSGSNQVHDNMQPYMALNAFIKL